MISSTSSTGAIFPHLPGEGLTAWALPNLNREFQISVGTAGPQPRAPDLRGHCRTSTASSRAHWALPNLNREFQISVGTAGPQPRAPDLSGHCRTSTASARCQRALPDLNRELQSSLGTAKPQPRVSDLRGHCRTSTTSSRSQWALPDLNRERQMSAGTAGPQRRKCQNTCLHGGDHSKQSNFIMSMSWFLFFQLRATLCCICSTSVNLYV